MPLLDATTGIEDILATKGGTAAIWVVLGGVLVKVLDRLFLYREKKIEDSAAIRAAYDAQIARMAVELERQGAERRKQVEEEREDAGSWEGKYRTLLDQYTQLQQEHSLLRGRVDLLTYQLERLKS